MLRGTIRNMEAKFEQRRREIDAEKDVEISFDLIGCGLLNIGGVDA
jgi:hypothetical protein